MIERLTSLLAMLRSFGTMKFWALCGASVILTFIAMWLICIVAYGDWPLMQSARRLDILGKALWFTLFMVLVVVASLTLSKISAKGPGGVSFDIGHDDEEDPPPPVATVTTTTKVETNQ